MKTFLTPETIRKKLAWKNPDQFEPTLADMGFFYAETKRYFDGPGVEQLVVAPDFQQKFAKAEAIAEKALSFNEKEEWVNANLAIAYLMQGKLDDAKALYSYLKNGNESYNRPNN